MNVYRWLWLLGHHRTDPTEQVQSRWNKDTLQYRKKTVILSLMQLSGKNGVARHPAVIGIQLLSQAAKSMLLKQKQDLSFTNGISIILPWPSQTALPPFLSRTLRFQSEQQLYYICERTLYCQRLNFSCSPLAVCLSVGNLFSDGLPVFSQKPSSVPSVLVLLWECTQVQAGHNGTN